MTMANTTEDQIRIRAHHLWEIAGRPAGREREFWYEAERKLKASSHTSSTNDSNPDDKSDTFLE